MMKIKYTLILFSIFFAFNSCKKDENRSWEYWSQKAQEKVEEINKLSSTVPCNNPSEFEVISHHRSNLLTHPSIKDRVNQLIVELDDLISKEYIAMNKAGIIVDYMGAMPYVKVACVNNQAKIIYPSDLSIQELNEELTKTYSKVKTFYANTACTNALDWSGTSITVNCEREPLAIHKTLKNGEFYNLLAYYNSLSNTKNQKEARTCDYTNLKPIIIKCVDGKAVAEFQ